MPRTPARVENRARTFRCIPIATVPGLRRVFIYPAILTKADFGGSGAPNARLHVTTHYTHVPSNGDDFSLKCPGMRPHEHPTMHPPSQCSTAGLCCLVAYGTCGIRAHAHCMFPMEPILVSRKLLAPVSIFLSVYCPCTIHQTRA
jgi:hypothetical protein